jgi:hypothetical protein
LRRCRGLRRRVLLAGLGHALLEGLEQVQNRRLFGRGGRRLLGEFAWIKAANSSALRSG